MIQTEQQKRLALEEIAYLKEQTGQSWLGGERMRQRIGRLRDQIDDYDRRTRHDGAAGTGGASAS